MSSACGKYGQIYISRPDLCDNHWGVPKVTKALNSLWLMFGLDPQGLQGLPGLPSFTTEDLGRYGFT
jgi:hypothetical protein